jgi:hypothetical protein
LERRFDLTELGRRADLNVRQAGAVALLLAVVCFGVGMAFLALNSGLASGGVPWGYVLGGADLVGGLLALAVLVPSLRSSYTMVRVGDTGVGMGDALGREEFCAWDEPDTHWVITDFRKATRSRAGLGLRLSNGGRFARGATLSTEAFDTLVRLARFKGMKIDDVADRELATRRIEIRPRG